MDSSATHGGPQGKPGDGEAPVFIVGTERSGSNLLRLMLEAHSRFAVPHPPQILRYFTPLEPRYGDLEQPNNLGRLVDDVLGLVQLHIHPWEMRPRREEVLRLARPEDLCGVFLAVYELYRQARGKARWGCKSTFCIHHVDRLRQACPGARFIWLVRDPRDVAASSRRSVFSPYHPWHTAELWRRQQQIGLQLEGRLPGECWLRLRYEDLLASPETELERLCAFLDEPMEPEMLTFHGTREARVTSALSEDWRNTARPILKKNSGKYRRELSPAEIDWVEASCAREMEALGYPRDSRATPGMPGWRDLAGFSLKSLGWQAAVEVRSLRTDHNHWRRWRRDAWMAYKKL